MFESVVASALEKYLAVWVEAWDAKQINMGVWQGDVLLSNIALNSALFTQYGFKVRPSNFAL